MTYAQKLRDPRWQKKRLAIFQRDGWTCRDCGSSSKTLTVHHHAYITGIEPWEYPDEVLSAICEECHLPRQQREQAIFVVIAKRLAELRMPVLDAVAWDIIDGAIRRQTYA